MPEPIKGSCLCGRIAFEIDGKIGPIGQCHCSKCRKLSGTDGNAVFYTAVQSFRWLSGENDVGSFPVPGGAGWASRFCRTRSEEHTSELQSLMRISYAVFCMKKCT